MGTHTKTPWTVEQVVRNGRLNSSWQVLGVDVDGGEALVAVFETLEDATLCAAAPRLLREAAEALDAMIDMFERHIANREGPDDAADRWDRARSVRDEILTRDDSNPCHCGGSTAGFYERRRSCPQHGEEP